MSKKKRKRGQSNMMKVIERGAVLSLVGFCLFISYIHYRLSQSDFSFLEGVSVEAVGENARTNILTYTGISIPENANDIYFEYYAWQDYEAYIRFSLSEQDVDRWLETGTLCFDLPLDSQNFPRMENDYVSWWLPADAEVYIIGEHCGTNPYYSILVDQSDSNTRIVYIYVHTV